MFGVDITDHYVVYDHDKQCRDAGSLYPAIDVELYGKKARKVRMSGCWYPEFLFQSTAVSVHYTQRGNYLHFRLTDYGVKDVRGVFCQVLHKGSPINSKEYYQTILYDTNDSFSLYTPINEEIMTESISLCITGVKYWNNDQIIECASYPQKINATIRMLLLKELPSSVVSSHSRNAKRQQFRQNEDCIPLKYCC